MNELEKYERDIAKDMAILYCVEKDEMYKAMRYAVVKGKLTFEKLSDILKKVYTPELTKNDVYILCDFISKLSLEGMKTHYIIKQIRKYFI